VMNKFTLECILLIKIPNFRLFGGCNLFFSYFRILVIREIDFQDFGNSENRILDIGFRILTFRILTFRILTFGILTFGIFTFGILRFGITNSGFWTVINESYPTYLKQVTENFAKVFFLPYFFSKNFQIQHYNLSL